MAVVGGGGVVYRDVSAGSFFTEVLRDNYEAGMVETLNNTNFLYNRYRPVAPHIEGKLWVRSLHTGRSAGHSSIGPGGKLPDPDKQRYARFAGPMRHHYGRIQLDTISEEASASEVASFAQALDKEITGITNDLTRQQNRMMHMDGSGRLCEFVSGTTTVGSARVLTVRLPQVDESPGTMTGMPATYFLHAGMRLAVFTAAATPVTGTDLVAEGALVITSVDSDTTFTCDITDAFVGGAGDWMCLNTENANLDRNSSSYKREAVGIAALFSDANPPNIDDLEVTAFGVLKNAFQNVSAAVVSNVFARANILDGGGVSRPPTEKLLKGALTRAKKVNSANVSLMTSSMELQDRYGAELLTDRRFVNTKALSGGWTSVDFEGIPWVTDRDHLPNRLCYHDESVIRKYTLSEYKWLHKGDSMFIDLQDYDAFQARIAGRWTMACDDRSKLTMLTDLLE